MGRCISKFASRTVTSRTVAFRQIPNFQAEASSIRLPKSMPLDLIRGWSPVSEKIVLKQQAKAKCRFHHNHFALAPGIASRGDEIVTPG
jgi:hypothetical protein